MANGTSPPSERTSGVRSVFSLPAAYRAAQNLIGADRFRRTLVNEILEVEPGERVIDIGCGTADIVEHLPVVDYVGYDHSEDYITAARKRLGDRGTFVTGRSATAGLDVVGERDLAMAIGVLHHMNDVEATESLAFAARVLRTGGRLVTIDPTLVDGQHPFGRWLARRDRGQHVRSPDETRQLVAAVFADATIDVRHDLLRVPYSHVVCRATRRPE